MKRGSRVVVHGHASTGFLRVPHSLLRDPGLEPGPTRVILWLASQASTRDVFKAACAREIGVSRSTLNGWLAAALRTPYLRMEPTGERDSQGNRTCVYHVNLGPVSPDDLRPRTESGHDRVRNLDTDRVRNLDAKKISTTEDQKEDHSLSRSAEPTAPPTPDRWQPNHTHRVVAERLGLDLEEQVEEFLGTHAVGHETRATREGWDRAFTRFMQDEDAGQYWSRA